MQRSSVLVRSIQHNESAGNPFLSLRSLGFSLKKKSYFSGLKRTTSCDRSVAIFGSIISPYRDSLKNIPREHVPLSSPSFSMVDNVDWEGVVELVESQATNIDLETRNNILRRLDDLQLEEMSVEACLLPFFVNMAKRLLREAQLEKCGSLVKLAHSIGLPVTKVLAGRTKESVERACQITLKQSRPKDCVEFLAILKECGLNLIDAVKMSVFLERCVSAEDLESAVLFSNLKGANTWTFNRLLEECVTQRRLELGFRVFEHMYYGSVSVDMFTFRLLLDLCSRCHATEQAVKVYELILEEQLVPNVFVFNSLMNALADDWQAVQEVLLHMQSAGVQPDCATLNIVLKAAAKVVGSSTWRHAPEQSVGLLASEEEEAVHAGSGSDSVARRTAVLWDWSRGVGAEGGGAAAGLSGRAVYSCVVQWAREHGVALDVVSFSSAIQMMGRHGDWEGALAVHEDMRRAGVEGNVVTWTALIGAVGRAGGLVDRAVGLFHEMQQSGVVPSEATYNCLMELCVQAGQGGRACGILQEMRAAQGVMPNRLSYHTALKACGPHPGKVRALLEQMQAEGVQADVRSWGTLLSACATAKDAAGARQAFTRMVESGVKPDCVAYTQLIKALLVCGCEEEAHSMYRAMRKNQVHPSEQTFSTLLRYACQGSVLSVQRTLNVYQDMRQAGFPPRDTLLRSVIGQWAERVLTHSGAGAAKGWSGQSARKSVDNAENTESAALQVSWAGARKGTGMPWEERKALVLSIATATMSRRQQPSLLSQAQGEAGAAPPESQAFVLELQSASVVEARTTVLSALRVLKDTQGPGWKVKEDLVIALSHQSGTHQSMAAAVTSAIVTLLEKDLGITLGWQKQHNRDTDQPPLKLNSLVPIVILTKESLGSWLVGVNSWHASNTPGAFLGSSGEASLIREEFPVL